MLIRINTNNIKLYRHAYINLLMYITNTRAHILSCGYYVYYSILCIAQTHTHKRKHTHTHTHCLCVSPLHPCIAHAQCWTTCATDRSASQELHLTAASTSLLNSRRPCNGSFFVCPHTHTHTGTAKLDANFMHHKMHTYYMCMHVTNDSEQEK